MEEARIPDEREISQVEGGAAHGSLKRRKPGVGKFGRGGRKKEAARLVRDRKGRSARLFASPLFPCLPAASLVSSRLLTEAARARCVPGTCARVTRSRKPPGYQEAKESERRIPGRPLSKKPKNTKSLRVRGGTRRTHIVPSTFLFAAPRENARAFCRRWAR